MKLPSLILALALAGSSAKLEVNSKVRGMLQCACKSIHCARRFPAIEASLVGGVAVRVPHRLRVASTHSTPRAPASPVDSHAGVKEHDEHTSSKYLRGGDFSHRAAGRHTSFASHSEPDDEFTLQPPPTRCELVCSPAPPPCGDMDSLIQKGNCDFNTPDNTAQCWCNPKNSGDPYDDLVYNCLEFYQCAREKKGWKNKKFTINLMEGDFWLGKQYKIPHMTTIQGAGPTDTWITATGPVSTDCTSANPGEGRIGFLLGDHTVVKHLGFVAMDTHRFQMNDDGLCGGFVFETPGCPDAFCKLNAKYDILSYENRDFITHATIENIFITGQDPKDIGDPSKKCMYGSTGKFHQDWGSDDCGGAPQGSLYIPMNRHYKRLKSLADGMNVHGAAHDITIRGNTLWYAGDDNVGLWSSSNANHGLKNIRVIGNDLSQMRTTNYYVYSGNSDNPNWGSCVSVYGLTDHILIQDNICRGHFNALEKKYDPFVNHGAITFSKLFKGKFSDSARVWITGTRFAGDDFSLVAHPPLVDQFPTPDFTYFSMASARNGFDAESNNYVPFNWANVGGLVLNNCQMKDLDDSDPINDRYSNHYGAPDPSFITPGCVTKDGKYVDWKDDGPVGYGWYCFDSNGLVTKDKDGNKITKWHPDAFMTKDRKWHDYDPSCIHLACDKNKVDWNGNTWYCS